MSINVSPMSGNMRLHIIIPTQFRASTYEKTFGQLLIFTLNFSCYAKFDANLFKKLFGSYTVFLYLHTFRSSMVFSLTRRSLSVISVMKNRYLMQKNITKNFLKVFAKRIKWQKQLLLAAMCVFFDPSLVHNMIN